jgi:hypothetical protein
MTIFIAKGPIASVFNHKENVLEARMILNNENIKHF